MKRVIVLGGYGGFGARIVELLGREGFAVIVAGRSLARAEGFARSGEYREAARLDRETVSAQAIGALGAWALVDAAGPFQGNDRRLPRACITAGCHYLDIADAREFVGGIDALDGEARAAGVAVIAGASTAPALTTAAADALAEGLDRVTRIETRLSASNRAAGSSSITAAVLSYAGKPVRVWRGGRWRTAHGWLEMERERFDRAGKPYARLVGLCDVPDHDILPRRYPGAPATTFRAGTGVAAQNRMIWLAAWLVRLRVLPGALWLRGPARVAQRLMRRIGGERSAMSVELTGWHGGEAVKRRWELRAERGDGPWVPSLAVPVLLARLRDGLLVTGARNAAGLLSLADYERMSTDLAITQHSEAAVYTPLYARVMGEAFDALPPAVRAIHGVAGELVAAGEARVERGRHPLARLAGWLFGFPDAGERVPVTVWMDERRGVETWTRDFAGRTFSSTLSRRGDLLVERFGPFGFGFALRAEPEGLSMRFSRWWFGPIPMPRALAPVDVAHERARDGRFEFDVPVRLPIAGLVVHYRGWLEPVAPSP